MTWEGRVETLVLEWVMGRARKQRLLPPIAGRAGQLTLTHTPIIRQSYAGMTLMAAALTALMLLARDLQTVEGAVLMLVGTLLFGSMGLACLLATLDAFTGHITFDETGIEGWSFWAGRRRLRWPDVAQMTHQPLTQCFVLTGLGEHARPATVHVTDHLRGIRSFLLAAAACVPFERRSAAEPARTLLLSQLDAASKADQVGRSQTTSR